MPSNNPRTPKRSWRGDRGASPRPSAGQPAWKGDKAAAPGPRLSRGMKIVIVLTLFLLVAVGVVAVYLWMQPPEPFRLVLVGADYERNLNLDANVLGRRGLDGLKGWADKVNAPNAGKPVVEIHQDKLDGAKKDPVADGLTTKNLLGQPQETSSKTVVVFLSGDGGGDADGAYLWLDGADPKDRGAVYRVKTALTDLAALPKETKKLLLLDGSHNGPSWSMGQLHNDFVRSVKEHDLPAFKDKIPNLVVLCSCDVDQQSWGSEDYGQTLFAHYVVEGMRGAADLPWPGENMDGCVPNDGRITALELARYVQSQVKRWVQHNRAFVQEPLLIDDGGVADRMELCIADNYKEEPAPADIVKWSPPAELVAAWETRDRLAAAPTPPQIYAPVQWREFQDTLLRYETLLRTGGSGGAISALRDRLDVLGGTKGTAGEIEKAQRREGRSLANALPAPATLGLGLDKDKVDLQRLKTGFEKAWRDQKPEEFRSLMSNFANPEGAPALTRTEQQQLRLRVIGLILAKADQSPESYKQACDMLGSPAFAEGTDPQVPLPAEANFAVMAARMAERLPAGTAPPWDLVKQSLELRQAAETAALGVKSEAASPPLAERLLRWIRTDVEAADRDRREGEDLILSAAPGDRPTNSPGKLTAAAKAYDSAVDRAKVLRQALQTRDLALAELPYYTRWREAEPLPGKEADVTNLWAQAHQLCDVLEGPNPQPAGASDQVAKGLKQQFEDFQTEYQKTTWKTAQTPWRQLDALLSVPLIPAGDRMRLLNEQRRIGWELNVGTAGADPAADEPAASAGERAKALAYQQARLALAVLGKDGNTKAGKAGQDVQQELDKPEEPPWQATLDRVGSLIAQGLHDQAQDAAQTAGEGRTAALTNDLRARLGQAALDARFLDAGLARAVLSDLDPPDVNRRVQLHDLLLWQADRTRLDFWVSGDPADSKPYYQFAGKAYTSDARDLVTTGLDDEHAKSVRSGDADAADAKLAPRAVGYQWKDPSGEWETAANRGTMPVTDELDFRLEYRLSGDKDAPAGRPVVWAAPEPGKAGAKPLLMASSPATAALPSPLDRAAGDSVLTYTLVPHPGEGQNVRRDPIEKPGFQVGGLFRGRYLTAATEVDLYNRTDVISYQPRTPKDAFVAVQADAEVLKKFAAKNSAMAVVLDYSYSMGADPVTDQKLPKGKRRIDKALAALQTCLNSLPKGVPLSVLTFRTNNAATTDEANAEFTWVRNAEPWQDDADDLIAELGKIEPQGGTPLVKAIAAAAERLERSGAKAKGILVLTDGGDDLFYARDGAELRKEGKTMKDFLHARFDNSGIQLDVVGIELGQVRSKEEKQGIQEFQDAIDGPDSHIGTFTKVEDVGQLAAELGQHILQLHYWIDDGAGRLITTTPDDPRHVNAAAIEARGLDISRFSRKETATLHPFRVEPGRDYRVILQNHSKNGSDRTWVQFLKPQGVHVEPGEYVVLNLIAAPDRPEGFAWQRDLYTASARFTNRNPTLAQSSKEDRPFPWLLTVIGNNPDKNTGEGLEITTAVENTADAERALGSDTLKQSRPSWTWFQVSKDDEKQLFPALRFFPQPYYAAPVWRLQYADWPQGAKPALEAWWYDKDGPLPLDGGYVCKKGTDYDQLASEMQHRAFKVYPAAAGAVEPVVVESVGVEQREVEVAPGDRQQRKCLVVRLSYPPGRPYFAEPTGVAANGHEHRFYLGANRYTGIFYDVPEARAVDTLRLFSVRDIQEKSSHMGRLPINAVGDPPQPPAKE